MFYKSTRNSKLHLSASEVIEKGISDEGGLFVPASLPDISSEFSEISKLKYNDLAKRIIEIFLNDFDNCEIDYCVSNAYTKEKFGDIDPVKVVSLRENVNMLELWHGPTCAFKDMALQILPHFLAVSLKKNDPDKTALILVATSGDTGKAALEGFKDAENVEIVVFYPEDGVSPMQKMQMTTQEGANVKVCSVAGNFDDTQTGIKNIFTDYKIKEILSQNDKMFSSANSINFGRLLPQIIYYFYSYFDLYNKGKLKSFEDKVNIVVPTGNFGNILAAYFAFKMGLPVNKFICASNSNNVLTDFIKTGTYDKQRDFYTTISPSMDILVSSNLERLLYMLSGEDSDKINSWMKDLNEKLKYTLDDGTKTALKEHFYGGYCSDDDTKKVIKAVFENDGYLCDTHTAVAVGVYENYLKETNDQTATIIASTANPYKFAHDVLIALGENVSDNEFENIELLEKATKTKAPDQLKELKNKKERFNMCINKDEMSDYVVSIITKWQDE